METIPTLSSHVSAFPVAKLITTRLLWFLQIHVLLWQSILPVLFCLERLLWYCYPLVIGSRILVIHNSEMLTFSSTWHNRNLLCDLAKIGLIIKKETSTPPSSMSSFRLYYAFQCVTFAILLFFLGGGVIWRCKTLSWYLQKGHWDLRVRWSEKLLGVGQHDPHNGSHRWNVFISLFKCSQVKM